MNKMQIALVYCGLFLLAFGILFFVKPISAEETDIKVPTLAEGLDHQELSSKIEENADRSKWLSWFKGENLAVRGSFFGGRIRHSDDSYMDFDTNFSGAKTTNVDRFTLDGRSSWGGELGIGYKIGYGIELGISYMFLEINDYRGTGTLIDSLFTPDEFYNQMSMDIDSRAIMFNVRTYLDELTGIEMGRFSPYIFCGAGRATHKVTDYNSSDDETLNGAGTGTAKYNHFTSHDNRGEFAYRVGMGTLFRLTDHVSVDASASFMDWGEARASPYYVSTVDGYQVMHKAPEPDVRTIQGSIGIQFNF